MSNPVLDTQESQAKDPLYKNTIQDTVADAKRLLDFLGVKEKVVSAGCSFGSTCAILFAETYPEQVRMLLVNAIFLGRKQDAENLTPVAKYFYPDMLDDLYKVAKTKDLDAYFGKLILSNKKADNVKAMKYYKTFEHEKDFLRLSPSGGTGRFGQALRLLSGIDEHVSSRGEGDCRRGRSRGVDRQGDPSAAYGEDGGIPFPDGRLLPAGAPHGQVAEMGQAAG